MTGLRVTIVAANPFLFDSRFLRTAESLAAEGHRVTVVAWAGPGLPRREVLAPGVTLVRLAWPHPISSALRPLAPRHRAVVCRLLGLDPTATVLPPDRARGLDRLRQPLRRGLEIVAILRRVGPWSEQLLATAPTTEVFHCQSLVVLPAVHRAARQVKARFVYDVADYHSEAERIARMPRLIRRLVAARERRWARDAAGFLAVSDPVADLVAERWQVPRPAVVLNCPPRWLPEHEGPSRPSRLRDAIGVGEERPIVLFQGGFSIDRGLEELIVAMDLPIVRALDPMLVFLGYGRLQAFLEQQAAHRSDRMRVLPAVPVRDLLEWTAGADVSYVGQPPRTLNHRLNLPNKLFESLMAGVPVVVSTGNEQCRLVRREMVGACTPMDDPDAIAGAIVGLIGAAIGDRERLRSHCRSVALTRYHWEATAAGVTDLYHRLAAARP